MLPNPGKKQNSTLCIAAGKSGGHLIPTIELARRWHQEHPHGSVLLCTYGTDLDQKIYSQHPFISQIVSFSFTTFVWKKFWTYPYIAYECIKACIKAWRVLRVTPPEKIITTGGAVAVPICIVAKMLGIPCEVYELNVHPGKAVFFLSWIGAKMFAVFHETLSLLKKATYTDYPIRFTQQEIIRHKEAIAQLNATGLPSHPFTAHKKTLLVLGGSQGSLYLNKLTTAFFQARPYLKDTIQLIHQAGTQAPELSVPYEAIGLTFALFDFHPAVATFCQAADLVICRAGAGTLFELKFFKKKALIIPLRAASTSHQEANAAALAKEFPEQFYLWHQGDIMKNSQAFFDAIETHLNS